MIKHVHIAIKIIRPLFPCHVKNALQIIETGRIALSTLSCPRRPTFISRKQRVISRASNRVSRLPTTSKRNWWGTKREHEEGEKERGEEERAMG